MFDSLFSTTGLSLDRLRSLLEVDEAGSIADTAPGDSGRNSLYSRQLRELSAFFGCQLTKREGKCIKLTPYGKRLAQLSRDYMQGLSDFRATIQKQQIEFRIAAGDSLIQWLVIPRLGPLVRHAFGVRFVTQSSRTKEIIQDIIDSKVDFGVTRKDAVTAGMQSAKLGALSYVALVPRSLLRGKSDLTLAHVLKVPCAVQETDGRFSRQLLEIARAIEPNFVPALSCQSFPQTMAAVRSGCFAAVMPSLAANEIDDTLVRKVPASELDVLTRELVLVWNNRLEATRPNAATIAQQLQTAFLMGENAISGRI